MEQKLQPYQSNLKNIMILPMISFSECLFYRLVESDKIVTQQFQSMKTNFDINIPSIPSKIIKFKIQDIKSTAFGSQRTRFNENKNFLTKKFIESFNNFRQRPVPDLAEADTEAQSQASFHPERTQLEYRFLVPEEKKYMLHHYEKYRNYEAPISKVTKYDRGYSFYKTEAINRTEAQRQTAHSVDQRNLTDNFYFPAQKQKAMEAQPKRHPQPSCIFKNQTRKRVYSKLQKAVNAIPGPGTYSLPSTLKPHKPKPVKSIEAQPEFNYANLKQIITNIVANDKTDPREKEPDQKEKQKQEKQMSHMFVEDDRDRFGSQKYPIAYKVNVPGPGSYEIKDSLQQHAKKIVLVEQQRKLLKEWFNN